VSTQPVTRGVRTRGKQAEVQFRSFVTAMSIAMEAQQDQIVVSLPSFTHTHPQFVRTFCLPVS